MLAAKLICSPLVLTFLLLSRRSNCPVSILVNFSIQNGTGYPTWQASAQAVAAKFADYNSSRVMNFAGTYIGDRMADFN